MRQFFCGFAVGGLVVLAVPLVANAQPEGKVKTWFSGAKIMEASRPLRLGYAAGVADALNVIQNWHKDTPAETIKTITVAQQCLQKRDAGTLDQFADFAEAQWRGGPYGAAEELIISACR